MWLRTEGVAEDYNLSVPDPRARVVILNYVLENALVVSRAELPPGAGRAVFARECARCHELPDPGQHSPDDWAAVVIRMRQHMVQMLGQSPSQSDVQEVILYLEQVSRTR
jgi:cytochrome c2